MKSSESKSGKRSVLVVDDHPLFREGVAALVDRQPDLFCCAQASNPATALQAATEYKPDLALLDLRLGQLDSVDLIKSLKAALPEIRILVVSSYDQLTYVQRTLRAGALGYILKSEVAEELVLAIRTVFEGKSYLSRELSVRLLNDYVITAPDAFQNITPASSGVSALTDRELQVFQLIGAGSATREIAAALHLSPKTVETYRENIKHKLSLPDAAALVNAAAAWLQEQASIPSLSPPKSSATPQPGIAGSPSPEKSRVPEKKPVRHKPGSSRSEPL